MEMFLFDASPLVSREGAFIVSLMMFANDLERLAYLRELHQRHWRATDEGYFLKYVGSYTAMLIAGHCMECLRIVREIPAQAPALIEFINARPEVLAAYNQVLEYETPRSASS